MINVFDQGVWDDDWITVASLGWYEGGGFVPSSTGSGWNRRPNRHHVNENRRYSPGQNSARTKGGSPRNKLRG